MSVEEILEEAEELEEFFHVELEVPEIGYTSTIPRAVGDEGYKKILINDNLPGWAIHEARHSFHWQVIVEVAEEKTFLNYMNLTERS
jgi:hypothetical protein